MDSDPRHGRALPAAVLLLLLAAGSRAQTWQAGPAFPDATAPREHAVGLALGDELFAIGGTPFTANLDSPVHRLPAGSPAWLDAPVVEGTIIHHGAGVDALGRIVVFGGLALIGDDEGQSYFWDPVEGKQGNTADRGRAAPLALFAWATDDAARIYSLGGGPGAAATPTDPNSAHAERYDGTADAWQPIAPMPSAVADAAAVNDGRGHILVLGGFAESGGARTANVARYDVATDSWSDRAVADMPVALSGLRAVLGSDGRVYALGGTDGTVRASTWVLDLDANTWSAGPDMLTPREGFAAALGPGDEIHAMGGSHDGGGTWLVETLYTPPCPTFPGDPQPVSAWTGQTARLTVEVTGGTPLSYRWQKDGIDIMDGPSAGGGTYSGADTPSLAIAGAGTGDTGDYALRATNPCGSATSAALPLSVQQPASPGAAWAVWNLHPAGALSSAAHGIDGGQIVGSASQAHPTYGSLDHPMLWTDPDAPPLDLTPAGSVGGAIAAVADGVQAGWFWWPYTTPQGTGYHKHACVWTGSAASHVDVQVSGWEFGGLSDTDGSQLVGTLTFDESSTNGDGAVWNSIGPGATFLTPPTMWGSSATAVDAGRQYGQVHIGFGVVHAAMWSGSKTSFVDLNPPGSSWSYVTAAGDGQQVGRATFAGVHRPLLWNGHAEGTIDLTPPGGGGTLTGVSHGLQVGHGSDGGPAGAALWAGSGESFVSLHAHLDPAFTSSFATDVDVDGFGTISVTGYGYNAVAGRTEALLWRSNASSLSSDIPAIDTAVGGTQTLQLFAGPEHAGRLYVVLGTFSGTRPGIYLNPWVTLPLNFDAYTELLFLNPNNFLMPQSISHLDDHGMATVTFGLPPGLDLAAPLLLHHAYVVLDGGNIPLLGSNAEPLLLQP